MSPEIRFTPPRRANRRIAGLVIPWILSRNTFRWRLAPPFPNPLPPFPLPDMIFSVTNSAFEKKERMRKSQLLSVII